MRPLGPLMLDIAGCELTQEEREILCHPVCGGVILFARNYHDPDQLQALTAAIHELREPRLLIAVDQEGGRVQRFLEGFAALPPLRQLGAGYRQDARRTLARVESAAWLMAAEVLCAGVDFSFAPVLDIDHGRSEVIGDRALYDDPEVVAELGAAYLAGMHRAGMAGVGKHFPGHGYVTADSHAALPLDERPCGEIAATDLLPFRRLVAAGLDAVMPAHVVYSDCDPRPAGFSPYWLRDVLRGELGFDGVIFSDDLSMQAAVEMGTVETRALQALDAGCDMLLVCNDPPAAITVLEALERAEPPAGLARRLDTMRRRAAPQWRDLHDSRVWRQALAALEGAHVPA